MIVASVLLAGVVGAVIRYLVSRWLATPVAVLVVNVVGSAIGGVLLATTTGDLRLILLTGFCGGLTTFSTFTVETVQLVLDGKSRLAFTSVAANLVLGIGAAAVGYLLTR